MRPFPTKLPARLAALAPAVLAILVAQALLGRPAAAQIVTPPPGPVVVPPVSYDYDDVRGSWVLLETSPIAPLAGGPEGADVLLAINQPGLRLGLFDAGTLAPRGEIATGPGLVSVVGRPGSQEVWIVDAVTHSVGVVDLRRGDLVRTIRLDGREPHGLAFHPSGDRAWVACSATRSVDVIRTADYSVVQSIPIPALAPRGIAFQNGHVWVASFTSGNNTTAIGPGADQTKLDDVVEVTAQAGLAPLPDRDLFAIAATADPATDFLDPARTVTGVGTILFNVHARPGTNELWIPNTEALNAQIKGEKNFAGGRIVRNRVSIVDTDTGAVEVVDLDASAPAGLTCAQPTSVAFDPAGRTAWITGYGSDRIAGLDADAPDAGWIGWVAVPGRDGADGPQRSGPRGVWIDPAGQALVTLNKGDGSLSRVALAAAATSGSAGIVAGPPVPLGYDPTPDAVRRGRLHLIDAGHSASGTSSCASCHVDGDVDGLVWELSGWLDPTGTPVDQLQLEKDVKGPMVTQSLRSLIDSAPYHWRGEKRTLADFNGAFVGLMKRDAELEAREMADLVTYMQSLRYPANPFEDADRIYRGDRAKGFELFNELPVVDGSKVCQDCHSLPTTTSNEVFRASVTKLAPSAQASQLRGIAGRLGDAWDLGGDVGEQRTEQGIGTSHAGGRGTLDNFLQVTFHMLPADRVKVAAFVEAIDTGLAPATAWQATVDAANAAAFLGDSMQGWPYIRQSAQAGHCDLVAYLRLGAFRVHMTWDPASAAFLLPRTGHALQPTTLFALVQAGRARVTLVGLPLGMGLRFGVDRDLDGLRDGDELDAGTDPLVADTDGDGYPDGYELVHGADPRSAQEGIDDAAAPQLAGAPTVVWSSTNSAKVDFETDEPARAELALGGVPLASGPVEVPYSRQHSMVVTGLPDGAQVQLDLTLVDPAGNVGAQRVGVTTRARVEPLVVRVEDIALVDFDETAREVTVDVAIADQLGGPVGAGYLVTAFAHYEDGTHALAVLEPSVSQASDAAGVARFVLVLPAPADSGERGATGRRRLHFGVRAVNQAGALEYVEAEDLVSFRTLVF